MIKYDDHLHLRAHNIPPLPHDLRSLLAAALTAGIEPGIREHPLLPERFRLGPRKDFDYAMTLDEIDRFFDLFVQEGYKRVGFESDYIIGEKDELAAILSDMEARASAHGLTVTGVNGSVHLLPGSVHDVDYPKNGVGVVLWDLNENVFRAHVEDRGADRVIEDYFGIMEQLVESGLYDTLSHIDLIRKFDRIDDSGKSIYYGNFENLYFERCLNVIRKAAEAGMAIEINTSGIFQSLGRPYISQDELNYAVELGMPVCVGSDSHIPDRLGAGFDIAEKMLRDAGRDYAVTFENRKPIKIPLDVS